jgi:uncharacterized protein YkwD
MSLWLLRGASAAVALILAAAAAFAYPLSPKTTAALPVLQLRQPPHRAPRPPGAVVPTTQPPHPVAAAPTAAVLAPPRVTVGSGQWGLINQDRAAAGLPPLRWSGCLAAVAVQNATRMAAQGFISHTNGPTLDLGCHLGMQAGENVGYLSNGVNDAQMNAMFMASPEHRANILGPYHYVGVSWVVAPNGFAYVAVEFG